jgi:hypothetical protein
LSSAKVQENSEGTLLKVASLPPPNMMVADKEDTGAIMRNIAELEGYRTGPRRNPYQVSEQKEREQLQGHTLLDLLRLDVFADVCENSPMSSLNCFWITYHIMLLFMDMEERFRKARHPLWVEAYEHPTPQLRRHKRLALVLMAMTEKN